MKKKITTGMVVLDADGREATVKQCVNEEHFIVQYNDPFWPFPQREQKNRSQLTIVEVQYPEAPF